MRKNLIVAAGAILIAIILTYGNMLLGSNEQADIHSDQRTTVQIQTNASTDAGINTSTDAGANTSTDAGANISTDAGANTSTDAGANASADAGANASADAGANAEEPENPIRATDLEGLVAGGFINVVVKRVVDGDTIWAEYRGKEYKVRLLCIDTPESVKEKVREQPFGKQASDRLKEMVLGREAQLLFEKDLRDVYDRLLAYVILEDGTCVNATMVSEGLARVNTVKPNIVHRDYFIKLQNKSINEGRGLWLLPKEERPFVRKDDDYYIPRYYEDEAA